MDSNEGNSSAAAAPESTPRWTIPDIEDSTWDPWFETWHSHPPELSFTQETVPTQELPEPITDGVLVAGSAVFPAGNEERAPTKDRAPESQVNDPQVVELEPTPWPVFSPLAFTLLPMPQNSDADPRGQRVGAFATEIISKMVINFTGRKFLPLSTQHELLLPNRVVTQLTRVYPHLSRDVVAGLSQSIARTDNQSTVEGYGKIFLLLSLLGKEHEILNFVGRRISDEQLPFQFATSSDTGAYLSDSRGSESKNSGLGVFAAWEPSERRFFGEHQWQLMAPVFDSAYRTYPPSTVLPFLETSDRRVGGYAQVFRCKIHPDHHAFTPDPENTPFAIKQIRISQEKSFRNELEAYLALRAAPTGSIVSLLGSFSHQDKHYLILPWAEYCLPSYWVGRQSPQKTLSNSLWFCRQLLNLASGINHLGDMQDTAATAFAKGKNYGWHGDIKPSNILMFRSGLGSDGESVYSAVICDLGQSRCPVRVVRPSLSEAEGCSGFTEVYRPPELDVLRGKMTPHWDIWGLGLIFLEFVCWFVCGPGGLAALTRSRESTDSMDGAYFDAGVLRRDDSGFVRLKSPILDFISRLRWHPDSSMLTRELLQFIENQMLVGDQPHSCPRRASPAEVLAQLTSIYEKTRRPDYIRPISKFRPSGLSHEAPFFSILDNTTRETITAVGHHPLGSATVPVAFLSTLRPTPAHGNFLGSSTQPLPSFQAGEVPGLEAPQNRRRNLKRRLSAATGGWLSATKKLRCPFHAHDPAKFGRDRTCCGPGWDSTHRVKEHLRRRHLQKEGSQGDQNDIADDKLMTKTQELGISRRSRNGLTEDEKWKVIYLLLFPGTAQSMIPSPYFDG